MVIGRHRVIRRSDFAQKISHAVRVPSRIECLLMEIVAGPRSFGSVESVRRCRLRKGSELGTASRSSTIIPGTVCHILYPVKISPVRQHLLLQASGLPQVGQRGNEQQHMPQ